MSDRRLFPQPLPIVVITGEYESGKTLAILTTGYPEDRTLLYDNEQSATLYEAVGNFTRVDITSTLPDNWSNLMFYQAWLQHMRGVEPRQHDVIGVDPIERVEAGLTEWVGNNPKFFGRSANQYQRATGLFWADVKDLWGRHILELASKCEMLILTAHMRNVYKGGKPTNQRRRRKGKETLSELATLELELVRKPGMVKPAAKVLKSRLVYGHLSEPSKMRPMFDPYIKEFTWERVREYIKTGADPDNLQMPPEPSQEEKRMRELELKAEIARAETARIEAGCRLHPMRKSSAPCAR